ncbi:condensation domain-containing protein, partial [Dactylosporangium darangshiense]|uniref:condensation domain-containing protein n=1 Tax=Dactylosporangium darangshiense TaxID=579108 RepID=UPI0031E500BF
DTRLIAYVVTTGDLPPADELRTFLRSTLTDHQIPSIFIELAALPTNANGKLDRNALPAPDTSRPELSGGYQPPRTATEEILTGIWADLLDLDRVGITDNFFDLGGHSLLGTQVITRIRTLFDIELPTAALFDHPTVNRLAAAVDATTTGVAVTPITPCDRDRPLPLSFAQQRLWFLADLHPGAIDYNLPMEITFDGPVDSAALTAALTAIIARHEILRTRLVTDADGTPHQVIDPPGQFSMDKIDVTGEPDPRA